MELTLWQRMAITSAHRKEWYAAMAKVADDGLPVYDALELMGQSFVLTKHPLAPLVKVLLLRLRGGGGSGRGAGGRRTFGTELRGMVPDDEAMLVQAGDLSGQVSAGLKHAQVLVETKNRLRAAVITALFEPLSYIVALIGLLIFVSTQLIPKYEETRPRSTWPEGAQLLGMISDNVVALCFLIVGSLVFLAVSFRWIAPNWIGPRREWFDKHVFPFTILAAFNGASFLTSISGYISAGVPFVEAVRSLNSTSTPYLKTQCSKLLVALKRGKRAEDALCELSIVPARYHWIIRLYSMSNDTALTYEAMAAEMVGGAEKFVIRMFTTVVGKLILLGIGVFLFWVFTTLYGIGTLGGGSRL